MKKITPKLLQQIASIVQPICTKSDTPQYTVDELYRKTINLVAEMIVHYEHKDHSKVREAREKMLIGEKGTILDAIATLQKMAIQRGEYLQKRKLQNGTTSQKTVGHSDLKIIQQFIERLPEAYEHENQSE